MEKSLINSVGSTAKPLEISNTQQTEKTKKARRNQLVVNIVPSKTLNQPEIT
jgi:hypothetical protein